MKANLEDKLEDLMYQFDTVAYIAESTKNFTIGNFKVYEDQDRWIVKSSSVVKEFTTRMGAISWAKFMVEGKTDCATTVEMLSEELDGATAQVRQLIKASKSHDAILGKIDPALDKRKLKVNKLADFILKNS
jgi:hypothetical protein